MDPVTVQDLHYALIEEALLHASQHLEEESFKVEGDERTHMQKDAEDTLLLAQYIGHYRACFSPCGLHHFMDHLSQYCQTTGNARETRSLLGRLSGVISGAYIQTQSSEVASRRGTYYLLGTGENI